MSGLFVWMSLQRGDSAVPRIYELAGAAVHGTACALAATPTATRPFTRIDETKHGQTRLVGVLSHLLWWIEYGPKVNQSTL